MATLDRKGPRRGDGAFRNYFNIPIKEYSHSGKLAMVQVRVME